MRKTPSRRTGFTVTDVAIALAVLVFLAALLLPAIHLAQEEDRRKACTDNLRQIALAGLMYANADVRTGTFPRTYYNRQGDVTPTQYTAADSPVSFSYGTAGPAPNDVTAGFYLLLRTQDITPDKFVCPGSDAEALKFAAGDNVKNHANFPSRQYLSYSYANPYPHPEALNSGWRFNNRLGADAPFAADMNPGGDALLMTPHDASADQMKAVNSPNHGGEGQNVVYCDGHVEFQKTPYCGSQAAPPAPSYGDNIYAAGVGKPGKPGGGVVKGPPMARSDMVLLPVIADGPQPPAEPKPAAAGAAVTASAPPAQASGSGVPWGLVGGGIAVLVVALVVLLVALRRRPATTDQAGRGR